MIVDTIVGLVLIFVATVCFMVDDPRWGALGAVMAIGGGALITGAWT